MDFMLKEDLDYYKLITKKTDLKISEDLNITRMTLSRWLKKDDVSVSSLESIYSMIYNDGIYINKLKEELYKSYEKEDTLVLFYGAKSRIDDDPSIEFSGKTRILEKAFI